MTSRVPAGGKGADRKALREAVANVLAAVGCGCCGDREAREEAEAVLAKLLRVRKYSDGSGYDYPRYRSKRGAK